MEEIQEISLQKIQKLKENLSKRHANNVQKGFVTTDSPTKKNAELATLYYEWLSWIKDRDETDPGCKNMKGFPTSCCKTHKTLETKLIKMRNRAWDLSEAENLLSPSWWTKLKFPTKEQFIIID